PGLERRPVRLVERCGALCRVVEEDHDRIAFGHAGVVLEQGAANDHRALAQARNAATHLPLRRRRVAPVPAQVRMRDHHAAATRAPGFAADLRQELDAHLLGAAPEPGVARKATRIAVAEAKRDRALPAEVLEPRRSPAGPQAVALVQPL